VLPGDPVYEGMIIGEHNRGQDINVNSCKEKKLTNMRASGKDDNVMLSPVKPITLEQTISFIRDDELVEVTPQSVRMRKAVLPARMRYSGTGAKTQKK
jgi:GTP-binding protein